MARVSRSAWGQFVMVVVFLMGVGLLSYWMITSDMKKEDGMPLMPARTNLSAWDWRSLTDLSERDMIEALDFAKGEGVSRVYMSVDQYLDIYERPEGDPTRREDLLAFETRLRNFNTRAHERGIKVEALVGNADWSKPDYQYVPPFFVDFVASYNAEVAEPERLNGLQFDIEPHNQADFDGNEVVALTDLLDTVRRTSVKKAELDSMDEVWLGWTLPYWYDGESQRVPSIDWQGSIKPAAFHILDTLADVPRSYITIMSYRNRADGDDGTIEHVRGEIEYAAASDVRVIVGQETADVEPEKITFHGKSRGEVRRAIEAVNQAFADRRAFGGVAIHTLPDYKSMAD